MEYEALLSSLKVVRKAGAQHLKVFSDSQLVVGHIKGDYEAREENMKRYLQKVKDLTSIFLSFDIQQISRTDNTKVDALSKLMVLLPTDWEKETYFEVMKTSSLEKSLAIQQIDKESYWIDPLLKYLRSDELLSDHREAQKVRKQAVCYVLFDDNLYRRSFSLPLLKCLHLFEVDYALREVHECICGSHLGDKFLSYKILCQGYY
ncbi:uncharacterized protein [Elaeis guineensis]|uniref:uncharacterized protein n=1 Tax=Elaeis guineensis var. tenera TaxID=51953 RepID=UPI003C6D2DAF